MKFQSFLRRNLPFLIFVVVFLAVRWSFADHYYVPSGSMLPTLQIGDQILVNKMAYDFKLPYTSISVRHVSDPQRGDIIVFENPQSGATMVKRLIALPGDRVEIDDGFVVINGSPIDGTKAGIAKMSETTSEAFTYEEKFGEQRATIQRLPEMHRPHRLSFTVPENQYFAMGDNRDNSSDSRVWGFIPRENLKGRAYAVAWNMKFENFKPSVGWGRML